MKTGTNISLFTLTFLACLNCFYSCKPKTKTIAEDKPYVIMLSVDGFRWDYASKANTPNLDYIASKGVKAESLKSSFPSKTFPNHYSMVTGLYPDHHGIVLNMFYDEKMDATYSIGKRDAVENPDFYGGEPIWVTAENQGVTTGSYFWVGSEAPVKGVYPTYWKRYDHNFPFEQRIDSVIAWLQLPEVKRPHLITWYMHEPDHIGHVYGPDSPEIIKTVEYLDSLIGAFFKKIEALPIEINIIITSDHGMGNISSDKTRVLDNYVDTSWFEMIMGWNPNFNLKVKECYLDSAFSVLSNIPNIKCWKSGMVPERFHYGEHSRTLDLIVLADSSWSVIWSWDEEDDRGTHGYDNRNTDMHGIFYAMGPAFKTAMIHPTFQNTDLYSLIAHILGLQPVQTDGSIENVRGMFKEGEKQARR